MDPVSRVWPRALRRTGDEACCEGSPLTVSRASRLCLGVRGAWAPLSCAGRAPDASCRGSGWFWRFACGGAAGLAQGMGPMQASEGTWCPGERPGCLLTGQGNDQVR